MINMVKVDATHYYSVAIPYYVCSTAAGTAVKAITGVEGIDAEHGPQTGMQLKIKLTNGNNITAGSLTLNGLHQKRCNWQSTSAANEIVSLVYNGEYWERG